MHAKPPFVRRSLATPAGLALRAMLGLTIVSLVLIAAPRVSATQVSGAVFTTDVGCTGVNVNIFTSKADVYINGGPSHPGAAGLPDGEYYVQVTEPSGTLLGTSIGAADETPFVVAGGEGVSCYQLASILVKASDGTIGYDDTTNPGGEYKVWVSMDSTFAEANSKTDNFKVKAETPPNPPALEVIKFYDANCNGVNDDGMPLVGWMVEIQDGMNLVRFTPVHIVMEAGQCTVTEVMPNEPNWMPTMPTTCVMTLVNGETATAEFGNVCLGGGGGHTLGFWSNKNGQAMFGPDDLALMCACNLRNATGAHFDPAGYNQFRNWLLNANATNMAYMLSAQMAAMELNVLNGLVDPDAMVYAPGATCANAMGFAHVGALMEEADAALAANGYTIGGPDRAYQEALKNALDKANNNQTFVQAVPCPYTFPE